MSRFCRTCSYWHEDAGDTRYGRCKKAVSINNHSEGRDYPFFVTNGYVVTISAFACNQWSEKKSG